MSESLIVDVLNELLAIEQQHLGRRLLESTVFVTPPSIDDWGVIQRAARASRDHEALLVETILGLDGVPGLRFGNVHTANLHYQELRHILSGLVAWYEDAINTYTRAATRVKTEPRAERTVSAILALHRQELVSIRQIGHKAVADDENERAGGFPDALP